MKIYEFLLAPAQILQASRGGTRPPNTRVCVNGFAKGWGDDRLAAGLSRRVPAEWWPPASGPAEPEHQANVSPCPVTAPWPPWRVHAPVSTELAATSSASDAACWLTACAAPGLSLQPPQGAFSLPRYQQVTASNLDGPRNRVLEQEGLAVVPGWPSATNHCPPLCAASPPRSGWAWRASNEISDQPSEPLTPPPMLSLLSAFPAAAAENRRAWC